MLKRSWVRKLFTPAVTRPIRKAPPQARPGVEALEERLAPAIYTVLNTNDTGAGSLRDAVALANGSSGVADTINFDTGVFNTPRTITLTSGAITFTAGATTTVTGPGTSLLSVSGNNTSGVFWINSGASASLSGLRITGGRASAGGGLNNFGTATRPPPWERPRPSSRPAGARSPSMTVAGRGRL